MIEIVPYHIKYHQSVLHFISLAYAEYGDALNLHGYDLDLNQIERHYENGRFWLALAHEKVVGTFAVLEYASSVIEFKRFFVDPACRGQGLAQDLFNQGLQYAIDAQYDEVIFWTDKRYTRAQSFFAKNHFEKLETSLLMDGDKSYQMIKYVKKLF